MAFGNCSTESVVYSCTMMVVVVDAPATKAHVLEVVAIGMAAEILSCFSFYFKSVSMSTSIF